MGRFRCRTPGVLGLYVRRIWVVSRCDLGLAADLGGAVAATDADAEGTKSLVGLDGDAALR